MARTVAIGIQTFSKVIEGDYYYINKTMFIKEWWESGDDVTLITRSRRFGKTLNMSMLEQFFSIDYADRGDLFEGLSIWQEEKYRNLQGTYPVISLSFARVKETNYVTTREKICQVFAALEECVLGNEKEEVKRWYDGFVFGEYRDIYSNFPQGFVGKNLEK